MYGTTSEIEDYKVDISKRKRALFGEEERGNVLPWKVGEQKLKIQEAWKLRRFEAYKLERRESWMPLQYGSPETWGFFSQLSSELGAFVSEC